METFSIFVEFCLWTVHKEIMLTFMLEPERLLYAASLETGRPCPPNDQLPLYLYWSPKSTCLRICSVGTQLKIIRPETFGDITASFQRCTLTALSNRIFDKIDRSVP